MIRSKNVWLASAVVVAAAALLSAQQAAPPEPRQLRANGVDLAYVEQGKGAPVLFVHGALGDLRFWEPQRQTLAGRHRFIAYTYRYHGTAPWSDEGTNYNAATHAADLAAFVTGLKAGPVHLVGLSYGGLLAAMIAAENSQLLRSLTLAEPALFSLLADKPEAKPTLDAFNKEVQEIAGLAQSGNRPAALTAFYTLVTGERVTGFDQLPEPVRQLFGDNGRTLPLLLGVPLPPLSCDALRAVKVPTLVIEGARTPAVFSQIDKAVLSCIAGSRLVTIPDASHPMSAQNPAAFNKALLAFLAKHR